METNRIDEEGDAYQFQIRLTRKLRDQVNRTAKEMGISQRKFIHRAISARLRTGGIIKPYLTSLEELTTDRLMFQVKVNAFYLDCINESCVEHQVCRTTWMYDAIASFMYQVQRDLQNQRKEQRTKRKVA